MLTIAKIRPAMTLNSRAREEPNSSGRTALIDLGNARGWAHGVPLALPKALVVGWERTSLGYFQAILEGIGLEVLTCTTYRTGLTFLKAHNVVLVLLNQGGRAFEGRRILEYINSRHPRIPVLVLTRQYEDEIAIQARLLGAVEYLEEPVTVPTIVRLVRAHFGLRILGREISRKEPTGRA
jgi:DNA-binding NtrC family response regulator